MLVSAAAMLPSLGTSNFDKFGDEGDGKGTCRGSLKSLRLREVPARNSTIYFMQIIYEVENLCPLVL